MHDGVKRCSATDRVADLHLSEAPVQSPSFPFHEGSIHQVPGNSHTSLNKHWKIPAFLPNSILPDKALWGMVLETIMYTIFVKNIHNPTFLELLKITLRILTLVGLPGKV
jgi:hypothetical protein